MSDIVITATEKLQQILAEVQGLLARHRLVENLVHRQSAPHQDLVEELVHKQNLSELQRLVTRQADADLGQVLDALPEEDRLLVWNMLSAERGDAILVFVSEDVRESLIHDGEQRSRRSVINAFELKNGRLTQVPVDRPEDLANLKPIWIDIVAPDVVVREWVGAYFGLELPDPEKLTDLEATARFYVEDNGEVHLHSDFLFERENESRNVPVALILHSEVLFTIRGEELPVFRLQRMRARTQPGYVTDGKDVLLDLYAADAEYSADALEDVYAKLEEVGKHVLNTALTDEEAGIILADIAREEDLNGRIRRNVLDTRRALSFLMRGKFLSTSQWEDSRQILRDIESLDGHTSFLFGKINFLMDAVVGFININQNKIIKRLTVLSVIFMPLNFIASAGGMSEFSMMTQALPGAVSYGAFTLGMIGVAYITYVLLRAQEKRETTRRRFSKPG